MPSKDEQDKERSKISLRIGEVQVELEGTQENIKKLMSKELYDFAKGLEETSKQRQVPAPTPSPIPPPTPTEITQKPTPKAPEVTPKAKTVPPPSKPSAPSGTPPQAPRVPTTGKKPEKVGKRTIGWKTVAIALVLVGIVLSAGLVSVLAIYLPMVNNLNSQITEKDTDIAALTSQVASLNSQMSSLQATIDQNNQTIKNLQDGVQILNSQIQGYLNIVYLNASGYLFASQPVSQNASEATIIFQNTVDYPGFVAVSAQAASNTTYIGLSYSSYGVNYNQNVTVGKSGTAYFPVLPATIGIIIGNEDTYTDGYVNNATVTAVYHY
jgi:outer membrane biosynthesis protein TonB